MSYQYRAGLKSGTYFQVPLCAFAFGSSYKERFGAIISYGLLGAGEKWWRRATRDEQQQHLAIWAANKPAPDYNRHQARHHFAARGGEVTNVTIGSVCRCLAECDALRSFHYEYVVRNGADPQVRLKSKFLFEARDGTGVSALELSVLAAIYSIIGNKQGPVLITQERIRCRALGYKSGAAMKAEMPTRKDGAQVLTDWQLRSMLDKLTSRKFFARVTYGRRLTYYSHRMTPSQLRKAVIERKTFMFANKLIRQHDDQAMTQAIQNQRAALAGRRPPSPDAHPLPVREIPTLQELGDIF